MRVIAPELSHSLATVDDIGAILIIALFYATHLSHFAQLGALSLGCGFGHQGSWGVQSVIFYLPVAVVFWFAVLESGTPPLRAWSWVFSRRL